MNINMIEHILKKYSMKRECDKIYELNEKCETLSELQGILDSGDSPEDEGNHFEFREHYGTDSGSIRIPQKYTNRIKMCIAEIVVDLRKEIDNYKIENEDI